MAETFHFSISMISRGKSKSAVASAAYISCEKIKNEWDGEIHDYHNKKGLLHSEIFLPKNIPKEFKERSYLWNSVELNEKANNAQLARNFIIALPKELSFEENKKLITDFIQENFVSKGMIADLAIHDKTNEENNNIHAHIMTTLRPINEKGQWQAKSKKEYVLDENGEKIKLKSGNYKTRKIELTDWNDKGNAEKWRENFANLCNEYLSKNNIEKRVDHRSYKRQGIEEIPTIHLGASASALEKKGVQTEKGNINREIKKHNTLVKAIKKKIKELSTWIDGLIGNLKSKYDEYKQEKKDELENKAELFNLYEYLSIYNDIQGEKRKNLSYYGQIKKGNADLQRFAKAINYLRNNKLQTIADLQGKILELAKQSKKISKDIKEKTQRIKDLNQCLNCVDNIKNNKEIYQEYKNKTLFKDSFYKNHKEEIEKYKMARQTIEKHTGTASIKIGELEKEISALQKETSSLNKDKAKVQDEFKQIDHIKYAVKIVNDEYGIDLSIEIDKAIKRGEKRSVIEKLKKYQQQQEKSDQYRQKAKEKYKGEER